MQEKLLGKTFPLPATSLKDAQAVAARIEALCRDLIPGFPRTSPGAIALVHKAEREKRQAQGLE